MNEYRIGYINLLLNKKKIQKKSLKKFLGITNDTTIREICEGKDMYVSRLVKIADFLGVPVAEFFLLNGVVEQQSQGEEAGQSLTQYLVKQIVESEMVTRRTVKETERQLREKETECLQRLHEQQLEYEKELARLRSELNITKAQLEMAKNGTYQPEPSNPAKHYLSNNKDGVLRAAEPKSKELT